MDPTKTMSYRRWRNRIINKGYSGCEIAGEPLITITPKVSKPLWGEPERGGARRPGQMQPAAQSRGAELQVQKLVRILAREYRKTPCFRKEKVETIQRRIRSGEYRISGRAVVDKWFPESSETESR